MMAKRKRHKGFTLVEMLIAVSIFGVVALLASSSAFLFHRLQRKAINAQNVNDNIRFAIDTMAREIRTGDIYCDPLVEDCLRLSSDATSVTSDCSWAGGGCEQFSFRHSLAAANISYRLDSSAPGGGAIQKKVNAGNWQYVTDPVRTISWLRFYADGINDSGKQERVTIVVEVKSIYLAKPGEESKLLLQTTVSKRKLL